MIDPGGCESIQLEFHPVARLRTVSSRYSVPLLSLAPSITPMAEQDNRLTGSCRADTTLREEPLVCSSFAAQALQVQHNRILNQSDLILTGVPRYAFAWLNRAGDICEEQGHHGDFRIDWGYLEIEIHTHRAGGLTRADAVLAAKFDALKP